MKYRMLYTCILLSTLNGCMGIEKDSSKQEGTQSVTLNSGLKYTILTEAPQDAPLAQNGKTVTVHYTGWLDKDGQPGQKFDSSFDRNQPFKFTLGVGQVIQGWDQGVLNMKVGEKRRLFIPANLGYGAHGAGRLIPPHAALIFDVELLAV